MKVYVPLRPEEFEALRDLAHEHRRRIQDEAAVIIAEYLQGKGRLPRNLVAEED